MSSFFFFRKKLHCATVVAITNGGRKMLKTEKKIFSTGESESESESVERAKLLSRSDRSGVQACGKRAWRQLCNL